MLLKIQHLSDINSLHGGPTNTTVTSKGMFDCFKDRHFMVFYCILHGNLMCCLISVKISSLFTIIWDTGQFQKSMNILAIVNNVYK